MIPALLVGESTVAVVLATDCVLAVFENAVAVTVLPDTTARTAAIAADA
jgi:cysteine synthase